MKNIFISSTFRDMHTERDLVQERVLPALRVEARKYGDNVEAIDLRWGVDTSTLETDEGSAKVLKVCLDEIERSHPYMLIFLGERYGWIPKGELIEKAVKGREDKYITDDFEKSVTALEIEYGALSEKYGDMKHCVVCFREPVTEGMDAETKRIYTEQEEKGIQKLRELKERIRKDLGEEGHLITYTGTWDESAHTLVDFQADGRPLEEVLTNCYIEMFQQDWKEYEKLSWQEKEQLGYKALMESKLRSFVGREVLLDKYYDLAVNGTGTFVLQGEVGSGKTPIMCKLIERLQREGKKVFIFFAGVGNKSNTKQLLLRQMLYFVEEQLGIKEHWEEKIGEEEFKKTKKRISKAGEKHPDDICLERFKKLCTQLQEKVYFCIDSLEQALEEGENFKDILFHENVQMILSCADTFLPSWIKEEEWRNNEPVVIEEEDGPLIFPPSWGEEERWKVETIPPLNQEEIREVVRTILKSSARDSYVEIEQEILKKKNVGNSRYISLLIQRLNMMGQEELGKLDTGEAIKEYSLNLIRQMPEEMNEAAEVIFYDAINKIGLNNKGLEGILYFLAVSRHGLSMRDLQKIFMNRGEKFSVLDITRLIKYLDEFFYVKEDDRIDFSYKVIRQRLLEKITEQQKYEEEIKEYIKTLDSKDNLRRQEGMYFARITKDYELANELLKQAADLKEVDIIKIIKQDAREDEGAFYCELMQKERTVQALDGYLLLGREYGNIFSSDDPLVQNIGIKINQSLVYYLEEVYEYRRTEKYLELLYGCYRRMGDIFRTLKQPGEALNYYKKSMNCAEILHEKQRCKNSLWRLSESYINMRCVLKDSGEMEEAFGYSRKEVFRDEELRRIEKRERALKDVAHYENELNSLYRARLQIIIEYHKNIERALWNLEFVESVAFYREKRMKHARTWHWGQKDEKSFRELITSYADIGSVLCVLGKAEAITYYEEMITRLEEQYTIQQNEENVWALFMGYFDKGKALDALGRAEEALDCYEKILPWAEGEGQELIRENRPQIFYTIYRKMGDVLKNLGREKDALRYYEKSLAFETFWKKSMRMNIIEPAEKSAMYLEIGELYFRNGNLPESEKNYREALRQSEEIYKWRPDEENTKLYIKCLCGLSSCLTKRGNVVEAEVYHKLSCELIEVIQTEKSLARDYIIDISTINEFVYTILKYAPQIINLTIDRQGWTNVDELVSKLAEKQILTRDILEEIVRTDKEQRYSFNEDKTLIRIKQENSIPPILPIPPLPGNIMNF